MPTPKWAQELIINACLYLGHDNLPEITWRHRTNHTLSSGTTYPTLGRIVVSQGRSRLDAKLVVLHELAHIIRPAGEHHSPAFWDTAWKLYRWAKLPIRYCCKREENYRKGALVAYRRNRREKND